MKLRINKLISDAGLGSRREVDDLIRRGRVRINGKRADLGDMVGVQDVVLFDDMDLPVKELIQSILHLRKLLSMSKLRIIKFAPTTVLLSVLRVSDCSMRARVQP